MGGYDRIGVYRGISHCLSNTLVYVKLAVIYVNGQCILSMYGIQWSPGGGATWFQLCPAVCVQK